MCDKLVGHALARCLRMFVELPGRLQFKVFDMEDKRRVSYLDDSDVGASSMAGSRGIRQMEGRPLQQQMAVLEQDPPPALRAQVIAGSAKILVDKRQKDNQVLRFIQQVPYEVVDGLVADYVLGDTACALFISLRYHLLHPQYIKQRIARLARDFSLRLLLCLVDVEDNEKPLLEMNTVAVLNDFTLVLAWSFQEAGRYLETYKAYEHKPATSIQDKVDADFVAKLQDCLGSVRSVNKTDVVTLASNFGSFQAICKATMEELAMCPGLGDKKVVRIYEALHSSW